MTLSSLPAIILHDETLLDCSRLLLPRKPRCYHLRHERTAAASSRTNPTRLSE
jgi:hypothetical protein